MVETLGDRIKNGISEFRVRLRSIPSVVVTLFVLSVVFMNVFGSRELYNSTYFCLNTGILFSWIPFICMDCVVKRFGAKAAIKLNVFAVICEILVSVAFYLVMLIPGTWSATYACADTETASAVNTCLNSTFASTWYVVLGSVISMLVSGVINSLLNSLIGKKVDKDGRYKGFAIRSLGSTIISQWIDNLLFSAIVSHVFFGWTWTQVLICATTSMFIEMIAEAILTPYGYRIAKRWETEGVGL